MRSSRTLLLALLFFVGPCVRAQAGWQTIGNVSSFEKTSDGITIRAQRGSIRVSVLSPTVVRVRYSQQNQFSDRVSFAVLPERFRRVEHPQWQLQDSPRDISLTTGAITARIYKSPARITFLRGDGSVISEDLPASPPAFNGSEFKVWKS